MQPLRCNNQTSKNSRKKRPFLPLLPKTMIIFLFGQDTYRLQEKLKEITEHYKKVHKSGLNLIQIDAKKTAFRDFSDKLKITPMFAETKLIILKNVFSSANFQEEFLKEAKGLIKLKDIIIVFEEDGPDGKINFFSFLKKKQGAKSLNQLTAKN